MRYYVHGESIINCATIHAVLADFQNSFTAVFSMKFNKIHVIFIFSSYVLKGVTALPC